VTLTDEYTPAASAPDFAACYPAHTGNWQSSADRDYTINLNYLNQPLGIGYRANGFTDLYYQYGQYSLYETDLQITTNPSVVLQHVPFYYEFKPNDPSQASTWGPVFTVPAPLAGGTGTYGFNPVALPVAFSGTSISGSYLLHSFQLQASGAYLDASAKSGIDVYAPLDVDAMSSGTGIVQAPNPNSDLNEQYELYGRVYVATDGAFKITGGPGFTIYADSVSSANIIPSGTVVQAGQGAGTYLIVPNASAADGAQFTVTVTLLDPNGVEFGSQSVKFTNRRDIRTQGYSVSFSEAAGARYRKIGFNGRPLADEKPQETAESDSEKEESYIDALNLTLHHSVTDVRVKIPGSDLALQVRRNTASEVWDMHSGFRPHERLDRPFGAGWNSNLCVYADTQTTGGGLSYTYIIDQNGDSHRFLNLAGAVYVPLPSDSRENSDYLTSFDGTTFVDRYGTSIVFNRALSIASSIAGDRYEQEGLESHAYARASTVTDRFNNQIVYTYPAGVSTLIPSAITWAGGQGQTIAISQNSGRVTDVWDPNGNHFHYDYDQKAYTFSGSSYTAPVLKTVTLPTSDTILYGTNLFEEGDKTPVDITNGQASDPFHIDVSSITDPSGNTTSFTYSEDHSRKGYDFQSQVYYPLCGAPANVTGITLPGGLGTVTLANQSTVELAVDASGHLFADNKGNPFLTADSVRKNVITDAAGNVVTYTFGGGQAMNAGGIYNTPLAAAPKIVFYTTMEASFTGSDGTAYGSETYTFNPAAGLALESVLDLSRNTTSFAYGDNYNSAVPLSSVLPLASFDSAYPDPTTQTDTTGQGKTFTYSSNYRILNSILDENNHYRAYTVDAMGRRGNEIIYSGADKTTPVVQETDYTYDVTFQGVLTGRTIKKQPGDPTWAGDLVTQDILDGNGRVKQHVVDPSPSGLKLTTQYTYDPNGNKLTEISPNGKNAADPSLYTTSYQYDSLNRLVKVVFPDGSDKTYEYYPNGTLKSETDENQHKTTYTYDGLNRRLTATRMVTINGVLTPETVAYGYNNAVDPKNSVTDPRIHTTTYEYDGLQRLTKVHDPYQNLTRYDYSGPNSGSHAFDSSGFTPTTVTDAATYVTTNTYDKLYRLTNAKRQYQLQAQSKPALYSNTGYGYDAVGNQTSATDDNSHTTTTYYDSANRPYHVVYADTHDIFFSYTGTGLKYAYKDELGNITTTQFDAAARPVYVYEPAVDDGLNPSDLNRAAYFKNPTTQTIYDANSNATAKIVTNLPVSEEWDYQYDVRDRKLVEQQPAVNDAETGAQNVRPTLQWGYDYVGNLLWQQDARGNATVMTYDEANRRLTTTLPFVWAYKQNAAVQPVTTNTYDPAGNLVSIQDPNGNTAVNTFDNLNRLTRTADAFGNYVAYGYDAVGNITSESDAWTSWTMAFDGFHRQTTLTDQINVSTSSTYNGVNKTARTDGNNQTTHYGYDSRNRLTSVMYPTALASDNQTHIYDFAGNLTAVTLAGHNTAADVHYAYDACHRLTSETSSGVTHSYRFDLAGNRLGVQYGALGGGTGRLLACTFDNLGRLLTMTEGGRTTTYGYDLNGSVTTKTLPSGEVITMAHDALNRAFTEQDLSPTGFLYTYLWLHDAVGNLCYSSNLTAGVPDTTFILSYDTANRLNGEVQLDPNNTPISSISYGYDGSSNRTQKSVTQAGTTVTTTYTYNHLDQLTGWSDTNGASASFNYDPNGNCTGQTSGGLTDIYSFDDENRLISVTKNTPGNNGAYSYLYDYRSRRVSRTEPATGTTTVVFSGGTSVQEYTGGTLAVDYVRGSDWGGGVGGILYSIRGTTPSFAHYNGRGDLVAHTDIYGGLTYQATYDAEGTHAIEFGATADRQKANTKEEDPTGLKNDGQRYTRLDSLTFLTRDPAGLIDGPNVYCYVHANPWTKFDPEGLQDAGMASYGVFVNDVTKGMNLQQTASVLVHQDPVTSSISAGASAYSLARSAGASRGFALYQGTGFGIASFVGVTQLNEAVTGEGVAFTGNTASVVSLSDDQRTIAGASGGLALGMTAFGLRPPVTRAVNFGLEIVKNGLDEASPAPLRELTDEEKITYERVSPRKSTRDAVREIFLTKDGKLYDAVTGQEIKPGVPWVMGHKEAFELRKMKVDAADRGISRKEFIEEQNNPNIYQPELPSTSSRGSHEADNHIDLPQPAAGTAHDGKY